MAQAIITPETPIIVMQTVHFNEELTQTDVHGLFKEIILQTIKI